jgi:hypothetical protein
LSHVLYITADAILHCRRPAAFSTPLPQSFRVVYDTAGSIAVIPTSFRRRRAARPHSLGPPVKQYMAAVSSTFSYARSLIPFVVQYISLSCHHFSYTHFLIPFVHTKREQSRRVLTS